MNFVFSKIWKDPCLYWIDKAAHGNRLGSNWSLERYNRSCSSRCCWNGRIIHQMVIFPPLNRFEPIQLQHRPHSYCWTWSGQRNGTKRFQNAILTIGKKANDDVIMVFNIFLNRSGVQYIFWWGIGQFHTWKLLLFKISPVILRHINPPNIGGDDMHTVRVPYSTVWISSLLCVSNNDRNEHATRIRNAN